MLATSLVACSNTGEPTTTEGSGGNNVETNTSSEFPVTIEHAFGESTIADKPERVATIAWSNHEVPLALGITPVGFEKATWGDDNGDGVLPWVDEKLRELGGEEVELFDATDSLPFEPSPIPSPM